MIPATFLFVVHIHSIRLYTAVHSVHTNASEISPSTNSTCAPIGICYESIALVFCAKASTFTKGSAV